MTDEDRALLAHLEQHKSSLLLSLEQHATILPELENMQLPAIALACVAYCIDELAILELKQMESEAMTIPHGTTIN